MAKSADEKIGGEGNGEAVASPLSPPAPSLDEMIDAASVEPAGRDSATALDDLELKISGQRVASPPDASDTHTASASEAPRRGRPKGSRNTGTRRKAEIIAELESVRGELETLRARANGSSLADLAASIELASFLAFGAVAEVRGPHWAITEPDAKALGRSWSVALAPHAEQLARNLPWCVAIGELGKIVYSRVREDRRLVALYGVRQGETERDGGV